MLLVRSDFIVHQWRSRERSACKKVRGKAATRGSVFGAHEATRRNNLQRNVPSFDQQPQTTKFSGFGRATRKLKYPKSASTFCSTPAQCVRDNRSWCSGRLNELLSGSQLESRCIESPGRIVAAQPSSWILALSSSLRLFLSLCLALHVGQQQPRFGRAAGASKREARLFALARRSINFSGKACGLEGHWHRLFSALSQSGTE